MAAVRDTRGLPPSEETPLNARQDNDDTNTPITPARGLVTMLLMSILILIQTTNISMMSTSQSDIALDLNAFAEATWFTSAYLIAMSSVTPLAGRLSSIFTPRKFLVITSAVLSLGLFMTAAANNLKVFLLGRVIAGCGSGGLMSTSIILVLDLVSKKRRGLFFGLISSGYTTGVALGAVLAGLLTPTFGWRFIYWFQGPLALILGPLLFTVIPAHSHHDSNRETRSLLQNLARIDYGGAFTLIITVVLLLSSLASPNISFTQIVLSFISFAMFVLFESSFATEPIVPLSILKARSVLLTCFAGLCLMMSRWAVLFFTPVYAIAVRGWSPASAGLILVPTNAGFGLGGLLVGWIHIRKTGSYYCSCVVLFVLFASATLGLSLLSTPASPVAVYVFATFLNGLFAGASMNYTLSHLLHLTSPDANYIVTSLVAMSRGLAGGFGSAIGGGYFLRELQRFLEAGFAEHELFGRDDLVRKLLGGPALVTDLQGAEKEVAVQSYQYAVRKLFMAGSILALAATALQAGTGWKAASAKRVDRDVRG